MSFLEQFHDLCRHKLQRFNADVRAVLQRIRHLSIRHDFCLQAIRMQRGGNRVPNLVFCPLALRFGLQLLQVEVPGVAESSVDNDENLVGCQHILCQPYCRWRGVAYADDWRVAFADPRVFGNADRRNMQHSGGGVR